MALTYHLIFYTHSIRLAEEKDRLDSDASTLCLIEAGTVLLNLFYETTIADKVGGRHPLHLLIMGVVMAALQGLLNPSSFAVLGRRAGSELTVPSVLGRSDSSDSGAGGGTPSPALPMGLLSAAAPARQTSQPFPSDSTVAQVGSTAEDNACTGSTAGRVALPSVSSVQLASQLISVPVATAFAESLVDPGEDPCEVSPVATGQPSSERSSLSSGPSPHTPLSSITEPRVVEAAPSALTLEPGVSTTPGLLSGLSSLELSSRHPPAAASSNSEPQ